MLCWAEDQSIKLHILFEKETGDAWSANDSLDDYRREEYFLLGVANNVERKHSAALEITYDFNICPR